MSVPATIRKSADLPSAFHQLDEYGARWAVYAADKAPRRPNGVLAMVNEPASWCTLDEALAVVGTVQNGVAIEFVGFMIDADRDLAMDMPAVFLTDLDDCIGPDGKPKPDAAAIIGDQKSYPEISRSGKGAHVLSIADPPPRLYRNKLIRPSGQKIEIYRWRRFVALTGRVIEGCTDELCDATEAVERLAAEVNKGGSEKVAADCSQVAIANVTADAALISQIEAGPFAGRRWRNEDGHTDRSSCDYRLTLDLVEANFDHEAIEAALRSFRHGQMGGGKLTGRLADRQICRLIAKAEAATFRSWEDAVGWTIWREPDGKVIRIHFERLAENGRRRRAEREAAAMAERADRMAEEAAKVQRPVFDADERADLVQAGVDQVRDLVLISGGEYRARPSRPMVVKGLAGVRETSFWTGPPKSGKSFLVTDLGIAVAEGDPDWFGFKIKRPGVVLYFVLEGASGFPNRLTAYWMMRARYSGDPDYEIPERFCYCEERLRFLSRNRQDILTGEDIAVIERAIIRAEYRFQEPVVLVIVDTAARALTGFPENDNMAMGLFMEALQQIADTASCPHVLVVAHGVKNATGDQVALPRGGFVAVGALSALVGVDRAEDGARQFWLAMSKEDPETPADGRIGFTLETLQIGVDEDGDPITSCTVAPTDAAAADDDRPNAIAGRKRKPDYRKLMELIADGIRKNPVRVKSEWNADVPAGVYRESVMNQACGTGAKRIFGDDDENARRKRFHKIMATLLEDGEIYERDKIVWINRKNNYALNLYLNHPFNEPPIIRSV